MKYNQRLLQSTDESNDDDNNDTMTSSCTEDASRTLNENEIENLSSSTHSSDSVMNKNVTDSAIESNLEHSFSARLSSLVKNSLHSVAHYSYLLLIKLYYKYTVIKENQNNETHKKSNRSKSKFNLSIRLKRKKENSDKYFILLFWLFICVKLRYDLYIAIPVIVIIWKLLKLAFKNVYCIIFESENVKYYMGVIYKGFERRRAVLAPEPFVLLIKLFTRGDHKVNQLLQKSIDSLISGLMIIALLLFVITSVIVLAMQVHSESVQFISIASNILNERVYAKPELREWLPEKEKLNKLYQASMNNLYLYGRESLSKMLRSSSINDANSGNQANYNKTEYLILEAQILNQFDILYAYLSQKASSNFNFTSMNNSASNLIQNSTNSSVYLLDVPPISVPPKNKENPIQSSTRSIGTQTPKGGSSFLNINSVWNLKEALSSLKSDSFDYKQLAIMVKNNFGLLVSVMDSVYLIVKGNVNLLTTILYTVLSILFSSGFALVNFIFSLIVYITALFYLLSMSRTRYKPFQWLTEISVFKNQNESSINKSQLLIKVIEESIRSVFVASLKMAAFYGIYTYIVYSLFSVSIVYLPSIVAALLAFLPIIGTYWTCIPGVLELWLIHNKPLNAIIFVIMHFLPFTVGVDKAIYSEIRGGHPYLTGRFAKY
jgi:predicted PurR-regulated permease PerM